jgi:endo-1,3-1,4-beta-glycanase ExoK
MTGLMRACRLVALLCAVVQLSTMAAPARSATPGFTDEFAAFDASRWSAMAHPLGRSRLDPRNVAVADARLALTLPAGTTDGAEIRTGSAYRAGTFSARIRAARAPSSITGLFLYAPPDYASEIDIEIFNDPAGTLLLTRPAAPRPRPR